MSKSQHDTPSAVFLLLTILMITSFSCTFAQGLLAGGPIMSVDPGEGPSGTMATITISGARPNAPVTLDLDPGSTTGTTDSEGNWSYTHTFFGPVGQVSNLEATIGAASEESATGTFEITGEGGEISMGEGEGPTMTVNPERGPSGTTATITISGALPNAPVTLDLDPGSTNGTTDADGNWTYSHSFFGQPGDVHNLKATIGNANQQSARGTFEITGEPQPTQEPTSGSGDSVSMTVTPEKGPSGTTATITITGALPNAPVTLELDPGSTNGTTDADGNWTYSHTFYGEVGQVFNLKATIGGASQQTATGTFEITSPLEQDYQTSMGVQQDPGGHRQYVDMPEQLTVTAREGSVILEGPAPWVAVSGELGPDGSLSANGSGTVAGYSGITVTFEGSVSMSRLVGEYTMGVDGGLPGGQAIVYRVEGLGEVTNASLVLAFFDQFNAAQSAGDWEEMVDLLHPAVLERYGGEACQSYLSSAVNPEVELEVLSVTDFGTWMWSMDDVTSEISQTFTAQVRVHIGQDTAEQEVHAAFRPDGTLGWFTDCGDPQ